MAVTVTNLIQGPGTLYHGDFGAEEPADALVNASPAASAWTDLGGTMDGVELTVAQEYSELEVDQLIDIPERRKTKREFNVTTNLAEATLENMARALNDTAPTSGSGFKKFEPTTDNSATQPTYCALIFDGYAPDALRRRVIGRKMLSVEGVETSYKKDEQTVFPVTFGAHYVSSVIEPFVVIDEVDE